MKQTNVSVRSIGLIHGVPVANSLTARSLTKTAVPPVAVERLIAAPLAVEDVDGLEDRHSQHVPWGPRVTVEKLGLARREEALGGDVSGRRPGAPHASHDPGSLPAMPEPEAAGLTRLACFIIVTEGEYSLRDVHLAGGVCS
jgi:hypothetical protein